MKTYIRGTLDIVKSLITLSIIVCIAVKLWQCSPFLPFIFLAIFYALYPNYFKD